MHEMTRGPATAVSPTPPIKSALLLLLIGSLTLHLGRKPAPPPPPTEQLTCIEPPANPAPPPVVEPPRVPGPDVYALLDACLRTHEVWGPLKVDVSQVRYWVEVEHDPAWFDKSAGSWWLPLSGEGEEHSPSGLYMSVPMSGAPCGGALVN